MSTGRSSRNRPDNGSLGTRLKGGKPQPRWSEEITLAKQLVRIRELDESAENVSVGIRIHRAHEYIRQFFCWLTPFS